MKHPDWVHTTFTGDMKLVYRILKMGYNSLRGSGLWTGTPKNRALEFWKWYQNETDDCPDRHDNPLHICYSTRVRNKTANFGFVWGTSYGLVLLIWTRAMTAMGRANNARFKNGGW